MPRIGSLLTKRKVLADARSPSKVAVVVEQQPLWRLLRRCYGRKGLPPAARGAKRLAMQGRCAWCNQESDELKEVTIVTPNRLGLQPQPRTFQVLPQYEPDLRRYISRLERFGLLFALLILTISIGMVLAAALGRFAYIPWMVALTGVLVIVFPFATPQTVSRFGFKTSITVVRFVGGVLLVFGAFLKTM